VCRTNGQQIGYLPTAGGWRAHDLATGWAFRTTVDEIYPFEIGHLVRTRKPAANSALWR
jgi:hypothetical protein